MGWYGLYSSGSWYEPAEGSCGHGDELSESINVGKFFSSWNIGVFSRSQLHRPSLVTAGLELIICHMFPSSCLSCFILNLEFFPSPLIGRSVCLLLSLLCFLLHVDFMSTSFFLPVFLSFLPLLLRASVFSFFLQYFFSSPFFSCHSFCIPASCFKSSAPHVKYRNRERYRERERE